MKQWNIIDYQHHADFVSAYGKDVLTWLAPKADEYILDLGCGDGVLALHIMKSGAKVLGVDSSPEMIEHAKEKGVNALVLSGEEMCFHREFDAVFSNAALHWMKDADNILTKVYKSLKDGGRFCAEMGGAGNVETITRAIYQTLEAEPYEIKPEFPWYFPRKACYKEKLEQAGFHVKSIEIFDRPTLLPTDIAGWLATFASPFFHKIPEEKKEECIHKIMTSLTKDLQDSHGQWFADYKRLRFLAFK